MPDRIVSISKNDIESILKVNEKAIELQSEVSSQNETIISSLEKIDERAINQKEKLEKIDTKLEKIIESNILIAKDNKETKDYMFKISVLLGSGIVGLIIAIVQLILSIKK